MAAVFPLDTTKPWVFNGVTYEYDATEDRWYVVSTTATDSVVDSLGELERGLDVANSVIDQEIENRTALLNVAADKNNSQDASLDELSGRIDAIGANVGILEFKGSYQYRLERSEAACDAAYIACLAQSNNDPLAMSECSRLYDECKLDIGNALPDGTFTSIGTIDQSATEELVISNTTQDGTTFDWENLLETGDYLELVETTQNDSVLYEVISDPVRAGTEERIRVKYIKETSDGDGNFNLQEVSEIRVIKQKLGLDIVEADKRYVQRPYQVIFSSTAPTEGQSEDKVLRNGELWYDTLNLELFVWNNNAWVTATKPASQDIVVVDINSQVDALNTKAASLKFEVNTIIQEAVRSPHLYYSDNEPTGNVEGNLIDGDLWVDSDDLQIKFYSQGAWINPDRTSDSSNDNMPIGSIIFWGGTIEKIPSGWVACSGQAASDKVKEITGRERIPNLEDYMPASAGGVFGSSVGGYVSSKLMKHTHSVSRLEPGSTQGNPDGSSDKSSSRYRYWRGNSDSNGSSGDTVSKLSTVTGTADFNAPPVYLGVYIMKVA